MEKMIFKNAYENKKVFITGNTGFKGSWLTVWLLKLGADVCGYSKDIPTDPSMFESLMLEKQIKQIWGNVCDHEKLKEAITTYKPDFIFHLAAQPIVSESYKDPLETLHSNVIGTANVLNVYKEIAFSSTLVLITSDKCYENVEWEWGYRENDRLGGKDLYSSSKACAELITHSFNHSFFIDKDEKRIATARAGNVIGGGDWAENRIIPDCIKAWQNAESVVIRSPRSTRPWQHVLEPLSGYLALGSELSKNKELSGESFNFGPSASNNVTVLNLIEDLAASWNDNNLTDPVKVIENNTFKESGLLKLSCDKALYRLLWEPTLEYKETVVFTSDWYKAFASKAPNLLEITQNQIDDYCSVALTKKIDWIQ